MNDRTYELGNEKISRLLMRYSAPAMVAMLANATYNLVDTVFVGNLPEGQLALAALTVSFPIMMLVFAVAMVVSIGSASIISRSLGVGDRRKAERMAGTSFAMAALLGLLVMGTGLTFLRPLLRLFGATDAIMPIAVEYMSVILLGCFFTVFNVSSNGVARSEGNVKVAMASMVTGAVINLILDPIFIFGLGLGVRGAAIATVIANFCAFLFLCWYFLSGRSMLRIRRSDLRPDFTILPEMFRIGGVSFFRMGVGSLIAIVVNNSIIYYGTEMHLAIFGVLNRVMMIFHMPLFGMIQGLQPIVGFNYGARNMARVKEAVLKASAFTTVLATAGFLIMMVATKPILSVFNRDPVMLSEGVGIVRTLILFMPFIGFQMIGGSLFQSLGKPLPAFILTLSRQFLFFIPLILILPRHFGLAGLWAAFPLADCASVVLTSIWVIHEIRALTRRPLPPLAVPEEGVLERTASEGGVSLSGELEES